MNFRSTRTQLQMKHDSHVCNLPCAFSGKKQWFESSVNHLPCHAAWPCFLFRQDQGAVTVRTAHGVREETEGQQGNEGRGLAERRRQVGKAEWSMGMRRDPGGWEGTRCHAHQILFSLALHQGPNNACLHLICLLSHDWSCPHYSFLIIISFWESQWSHFCLCVQKRLSLPKVIW